MNDQISQTNQVSQLARGDRGDGDLLFAGLATTALWNLLVAKGLLSKEEALSTLDTVLLTIEHRRETWRGSPVTLDQARVRMEALIGQIQAIPK